MLCAGILWLMRIRGWADRDGTVSLITSWCPIAKGEGQIHISSPLSLLSGTQFAFQKAAACDDACLKDLIRAVMGH